MALWAVLLLASCGGGGDTQPPIEAAATEGRKQALALDGQVRHFDVWIPATVLLPSQQVDKLMRDHARIDLKRFYVTGLSNGATMAGPLAAKADDVIAAGAIHASVVPWQIVQTTLTRYPGGPVVNVATSRFTSSRLRALVPAGQGAGARARP